MTEPFYAPHQLAKLQEGYYAVNRTYEQLLGEYLSLRLTSEAAYEYARHGFVRRLGTLKCCTGTSTGRLMIAVLGGLADVERDLIRTPTAEGRSRAKARGQQMGRLPAVTSSQRKEATRRRAQGATLQELADAYDRSISTMRRATRAA